MKDLDKKFDTLLEKLTFKPKKYVEETGPRYADVYARAVAACIDLWLIYLLLGHLFQWMTRHIYSYADQALVAAAQQAPTLSEMLQILGQSGIFYLWLVNAALQIAFMGFLIIGCWTLWAATPGKKLMGLKIVTRGTMEEPGLPRYIVRYLAYIPATAPLAIGVIWASFNKERRGWHDMIAGTVVIHTRPRDWYWQQMKRGYRWLKSRLMGSAPVEEPVSQPTEEQRKGDAE